MASVTDSARNEEADLVLTWSGRWTLTHRILAVNLLTLALLALSLLYLDAFRNQLGAERMRLVEREAIVTADALAAVPAGQRQAVLARIARSTGSRLRLFGASGPRIVDSWQMTGPTYRLRDPTTQAWNKGIARALDRGFNAIVGERNLPDFVEPANDRLAAWPEGRKALRDQRVVNAMRAAPDLTPVLSSAVPVDGDSILLVTANDRNFTRTVRSQRRSLVLALALTTILSLLLSLFLARTIVRPLRRLALAAHRVRLGRAREVKVPRLPSRHDEIGLLARSLADMSQSLRHRIDNIEAFAADVTHELKNPLASLRSAVDGLERVEDPKLRRRLLDVVRHDVVRLDRLITDVSRGGADRRRIDPRALRADRSWPADRADRRRGREEAHDRRRPNRLCPATPRQHDRVRRAGAAGARDRQYPRQCDFLFAARRAGRDRRRRGRRAGSNPGRRRGSGRSRRSA